MIDNYLFWRLEPLLHAVMSYYSKKYGFVIFNWIQTVWFDFCNNRCHPWCHIWSSLGKKWILKNGCFRYHRRSATKMVISNFAFSAEPIAWCLLGSNFPRHCLEWFIFVVLSISLTLYSFSEFMVFNLCVKI